MVIVFDLDDTLYDEVDFVKSGFKEIARFLGDKKYYDFMWEEFVEEGSGKIFDKLIKEINVDIEIKKLIEIYRFHFPDIYLSQESKELLDFSKQYKTALITDGHYIMQKNKYNALNIYVDYPIFTDFYHTKKPETKAFKMVMEKFPSKEYTYIADNPKKDFFAPKKLGWKTIRYKNPRGIYRVLQSDVSSIDYEVDNKKDIIQILKGM